MAVLTQIDYNVARITGSYTTKIAGAAVVAGNPVYLDSETLTLMPASAETAAKSAVVGIALNTAALGQPVTYQPQLRIAIGSAVVVGRAYYVAPTVGGICLEADLGAGNFVTLLGFADTITTLTISILASAIFKA